MQIIIYIFVIQLLYHISRVESLIGENITSISGGEFPFVASFQYLLGELNFCGGALITKKHVITSALCLEDTSVERFRIVFEVAHADEPAVAYTVASWTTYDDWVQRQGVPHDFDDVYNVAIVTLTDRVYNVNPVTLNGLTRRELDGTEATMIGWKNDVLSKATVQLLSGEDCERSFRMLRDNPPANDDRLLCSVANPFALLDSGDLGSPLLHAGDNSLLGMAFGFRPVDEFVNSNFSTEFIRQHQVNVHTSLYHYRLFIHSVIQTEPRA